MLDHRKGLAPVGRPWLTILTSPRRSWRNTRRTQVLYLCLLRPWLTILTSQRNPWRNARRSQVLYLRLLRPWLTILMTPRRSWRNARWYHALYLRPLRHSHSFRRCRWRCRLIDKLCLYRLVRHGLCLTVSFWRLCNHLLRREKEMERISLIDVAFITS